MERSNRSDEGDSTLYFTVTVSRKNPAWVPGQEGSPVVESADDFATLELARRHFEGAKLDANVNWIRMDVTASWAVQDWQNPDRLAEFEQTGSRRG